MECSAWGYPQAASNGEERVGRSQVSHSGYNKRAGGNPARIQYCLWPATPSHTRQRYISFSFTTTFRVRSMLPEPSLPCSGRPGTTPSASAATPADDQTSAAVRSSGRLGKTPSAGTTTPADDESSHVDPRTWYDRHCVPYAREVRDMIASWQMDGAEYQLVEVGPPRLALVMNGIQRRVHRV